MSTLVILGLSYLEMSLDELGNVVPQFLPRNRASCFFVIHGRDLVGGSTPDLNARNDKSTAPALHCHYLACVLQTNPRKV